MWINDVLYSCVDNVQLCELMMSCTLLIMFCCEKRWKSLLNFNSIIWQAVKGHSYISNCHWKWVGTWKKICYVIVGKGFFFFFFFKDLCWSCWWRYCHNRSSTWPIGKRPQSDFGPNHGCTTIHEDTCADNLGFSDGISDTGRTGSLKLSSQTDPSCPFIHTAVQCWFAHECQTDGSAIAPPSPW